MTLPGDVDAASLRTTMEVVERARRLAQAAHAGQLDKAGNDYYESHLLDVFRRVVGYGGGSPMSRRPHGCTTLSKTPG